MPKKQGPIQVLPVELQNQIAAGEVVERPANVVKELLENSLDAQADRIVITLEAGGQGLIQVQDNGTGMSADEIELALNRHATSKISTVQDLTDISSFGFRGEALPSIASISRLELASKPKEALEGSLLRLQFGQIEYKGPTAIQQGTKIEVRDLFSNTPARLKFLKTPATEIKRAQDVVARMALAHLQADLQLTVNGKTVYRFLKGQTLRERINVIWPDSIVSELLDASAQIDDYLVQGLVGPPHIAQGRGDRIYLYVNNRPVQDKLLLKAVRQAYKGMLLSKEYPQALLFLQLPNNDIDVNVHPAKSEVRFRNEQQIFSLLQRAIKTALNSVNEEPENELDPKQAYNWEPGIFEQPRQNQLSQPGLLKEDRPNSRAQIVRETPANLYPDKDLTKKGQSPNPAHFSATAEQKAVLQDMTYLGQIFATYLLLTRKDELFLLVDQHAAHERVLYTHMQQGAEKASSQLLALPLELNLHPAEQDKLQEIGQELRKLGFIFECPRPQILSIRGIPAFMNTSKTREFLQSVFSDRLENLNDLWIMLACKSAIKAGDHLAPDEALSLLETWTKCPDKEFCPHGRPVMVKLGRKDLEKMFKRGQ
jgi:DNA mismatch repair protein MutL